MLAITSRLLSARRLLAIGGVCAVAAFGVSTMPAAAFSGGATTNCGPFGAMICTGVSQGAQVGTGGTETVAYDCTVETTQTEVSTTGSVGVGCYLHGVSDGLDYGGGNVLGLTNWTPGVASTVNDTVTVPTQPYQLCVGGGWFVNGWFEPIQGYSCFQPVLF